MLLISDTFVIAAKNNCFLCSYDLFLRKTVILLTMAELDSLLVVERFKCRSFFMLPVDRITALFFFW